MSAQSRKGEASIDIDASTARRLAVAADCDPRTIIRVAKGKGARTIASKRARAVLEREGLLGRGKGQAAAHG